MSLQVYIGKIAHIPAPLTLRNRCHATGLNVSLQVYIGKIAHTLAPLTYLNICGWVGKI